MKISKIRLMKDRRYEEIPIDKIRVLNSRNRNNVRFQENIRSIKDVGLRRPIQVNERYYNKTGTGDDVVCLRSKADARQRFYIDANKQYHGKE